MNTDPNSPGASSIVYSGQSSVMAAEIERARRLFTADELAFPDIGVSVAGVIA